MRARTLFLILSALALLSFGPWDFEADPGGGSGSGTLRNVTESPAEGDDCTDCVTIQLGPGFDVVVNGTTAEVDFDFTEWTDMTWGDGTEATISIDFVTSGGTSSLDITGTQFIFDKTIKLSDGVGGSPTLVFDAETGPDFSLSNNDAGTLSVAAAHTGDALFRIANSSTGSVRSDIERVADSFYPIISGPPAGLTTNNQVLAKTTTDNVIEQYASLVWNITAANCTGGTNGGALTVNGSNEIVCSDDDAGSGASVGSAGDVQYSDGAAGFDAEAAFNYDEATNTLSVENLDTVASIVTSTPTTLAASELDILDGGVLITELSGTGTLGVGQICSATSTTAIQCQIDAKGELETAIGLSGGDLALTIGDSYSGNHDFSGASIEIENSAALTLSNDGEIGVDTTENQFRWRSNSGDHVITGDSDPKCATLENPDDDDDDVLVYAMPRFAGSGSGTVATVVAIGCAVDTGTTTMQLTDGGGTVVDNFQTCSTTGSITWDETLSGTTTFTEGEIVEVDTISAGTATWAMMCFIYTLGVQ